MSFNRKQKIEKSFGEKAHVYNKDAFLQKESAQKLCSYLPNSKPLKILEIGCGTGFLTEELQKKYPQSDIVATDISQKMIFSCQQKFTGYRNISFQIIDGENINTDDRFDLIVSNLAVQWFENSAISIQKFCQNLTDDGKIYFSTLGKNSFQEWKKTLNNLSLESGILETPNYEGIFEEEEKIIEYKNALNFLQNFKKIGAHQPRQGYQQLSHKNLQKACSAFDTEYQGRITWHILYGCLDKSGRAFVGEVH